MKYLTALLLVACGGMAEPQDAATDEAATPWGCHIWYDPSSSQCVDQCSGNIVDCPDGGTDAAQAGQ